jgi:septation ring formation regulator EzrA
MIEFALIIGITLLAWRLHEADKIMKNYDRNMADMFREIQQTKSEINTIMTENETSRRKVDHCLEMCNEILKDLK